MTTYIVGEGIQNRMDLDQVSAVTDELQIFGGRANPQTVNEVLKKRLAG